MYYKKSGLLTNFSNSVIKSTLVLTQRSQNGTNFTDSLGPTIGFVLYILDSLS